MTYAQTGEDDILARFFGDQTDGYFVDIGAYDGETYSNSLLFEQRGWHGVCVEPNPESFIKCVQARPQSMNVRAAIVGSPEQTEATLYLSQMPILATLDTQHEAELAVIHKNVKLDYQGLTPLVVPAITLDALLEKANLPAIDFLSIDTEWTNADVLKGFTFTRWQPRVMVIEVGEGVTEGMAAGQYHLVGEQGSNLFYVRNRRDINLMRRALQVRTKVSALVSVYNGQHFLGGRLEDLLNQTLYAQGRLEIVVIDAGSTDDTPYIAREYLDCITYIRSLREPMYTSLNRGVSIAVGDYVTTANVDDRLRPDALERLAHELDQYPDCGVVYADSYVTPTANAEWGKPYEISYEYPYTEGRLNWPEFDRKLLTQYCYIGPQPVWRKDLHESAGLFDESYIVAGDYEMWLRLAAQGVNMRRVNDVLGLFYWNASQQGRAYAEQSGMESRRAVLKWRAHLD